MADSFRFEPPDMGEFHEYLMKKMADILESVKEAYIMACTEAVKRAKETDTYQDRTNNLRSSIGFVLYYNGELIHEYFEASGTGTGGGSEVSFTTKEGKGVSFTSKVSDASGKAGIESGKELAHKVAERHKDGFVAIIVAGMHYALYVEAKGFDVLTAATLDISKDLQEYFKIINKQYGTSFRANTN